ncbi:hypothetical protein J2Y63_006750 [Shinella sp. BE166]|uniref:hypothetical protein n=1 Tax=Shinella sp. BE166 TaxID=3373918 RepID=UPI003EB737FA
MTIIYDVIKKGVFIEYQGKTEYLAGPFPTRNQAIAEAERFCRSLGQEFAPPLAGRTL